MEFGPKPKHGKRVGDGLAHLSPIAMHRRLQHGIGEKEAGEEKDNLSPACYEHSFNIRWLVPFAWNVLMHATRRYIAIFFIASPPCNVNVDGRIPLRGPGRVADELDGLPNDFHRLSRHHSCCQNIAEGVNPQRWHAHVCQQPKPVTTTPCCDKLDLCCDMASKDTKRGHA